MKKQDENAYLTAIECFPAKWKEILSAVPETLWQDIQEIRLFQDRPLALVCGGRLLFDCDGTFCDKPVQSGRLVQKGDIQDCFRTFCNFSVHTHQEEIRQGFLSVKGGHRVGLGGTAVYQGGQLSQIRDVTSLNFRVARTVRGSADFLMKELFQEGLCSVLIAGPPSSGKTTLLRDLAFQLSSGGLGECHKVAVVDERFEICGPDQSEGFCCDLLSGFRKADGILMAVRTLSPEIIFCDEIGTYEEGKAVQSSLNSGVSIVTTIHSGSIEELMKKPQYELLKKTGEFQKLVLLSGSKQPGEVKEILPLPLKSLPENQDKRQLIFRLEGEDLL